jgi:hypothetical protein
VSGFLGFFMLPIQPHCLKYAILTLLDDHHLTLTQVRGQGYDGASSMKWEIKGLKTLIMREPLIRIITSIVLHIKSNWCLLLWQKVMMLVCGFLSCYLLVLHFLEFLQAS